MNRDIDEKAYQYICAAKDYLWYVESGALKKNERNDFPVDGKSLDYREMIDFCQNNSLFPDGVRATNPRDTAINVISDNVIYNYPDGGGVEIEVSSPEKVAAMLAVSRSGGFQQYDGFVSTSVERISQIYDACLIACKNPLEHADAFVLSEYSCKFEYAVAIDSLDPNVKWACYQCVDPRDTANGIQVNNRRAVTAMRNERLLDDYMSHVCDVIKDQRTIDALYENMVSYIKYADGLRAEYSAMRSKELEEICGTAWADGGFQEREEEIVEHFMTGQERGEEEPDIEVGYDLDDELEL